MKKLAENSAPRVVLALLTAVMACVACTSPIKTGETPNSTAIERTYAVNVRLQCYEGDSSRDLISSGSVDSVSVLVANASGASIGTVNLTKATSYWKGTIEISESGTATFGAYAFNSDGGLLYVGKNTLNVSSANKLVSISTGAVTLPGGKVVGYCPALSKMVSTFGGSTSGQYGSDNGTGTSAKFRNPVGITTDGKNLYIVDKLNNLIRKVVIATREVTTVVDMGSNGIQGITTDGTYLYVTDENTGKISKIRIADGATTPLSTGFSMPEGITLVGTNLYVIDYNAIYIVPISTGVQSIIAGNFNSSDSVDADGTNARFNLPYGITTDGTSLYVADTFNNTIRRVGLASPYTVTTLAGTAGVSNHGSDDADGSAAKFYFPMDLTSDGTYLYIVDTDNHTIRQVGLAAPHTVTTMAGLAGDPSTTDGLGTAARFYLPEGITTDGVNIYIVDEGNNSIRKMQ